MENSELCSSRVEVFSSLAKHRDEPLSVIDTINDTQEMRSGRRRASSALNTPYTQPGAIQLTSWTTRTSVRSAASQYAYELAAPGDREPERSTVRVDETHAEEISTVDSVPPATEQAPTREKHRSHLGQGGAESDVVIIDWELGDPQNPYNWSTWRKYTTVVVACVIASTAAAFFTAVAVMTSYGEEWFHCSREEFVLFLTVPLLATAFAPMLFAPLSEVIGRNSFYQVGSIITALMFLPQIFTHSYTGALLARLVQGCSSSVSNSMVGGSVADLFEAKDRGTPMAIFTLAIFVGQSLGPMSMGYTAMNLGVPWCYGIQAIMCSAACVLNAIFLRETRGDVLLARKAKRLTRETGKLHVSARDVQKGDFSLRQVLAVSLVRPFKYLLTEPIVLALSAWIGFAWACIFLGGTSVLLVFKQYGFDDGQAGLIQVVVVIGGLLGVVSGRHQEYLYAKSAARHGGRAPPEARLYWAAYGGLMFPLAMFVFAWTGRPHIPWPIPAVCLCIAYWGVFCMYWGIFTYIADAYETFSSSAQSAQSFVRNVASAFFPLFARGLYVKLGYPQASTLVASVASVLAAAPILLIIYGKELRARSKVASALAMDSQQR